MNTRKKGYIAEELTKTYLEELGYSIIGQNYTIRGGEIDLIGEIEQIRVFFEVKEIDGISDLQNYISQKKLSTLMRTINFYNYENPSDKQCRVDLVFVKQNIIFHHYQNITNN